MQHINVQQDKEQTIMLSMEETTKLEQKSPKSRQKKSAIQPLPLLGILQIPNQNSHYLYTYWKLSANSLQDQWLPLYSLWVPIDPAHLVLCVMSRSYNMIIMPLNINELNSLIKRKIRMNQEISVTFLKATYVDFNDSHYLWAKCWIK